MARYRRAHPGSVSLMIKTCAQDAPHVDRMVRHIVGQLGEELAFVERSVLVDPRRDSFLRQYGPADFERLVSVVEQLVREGVVDHWQLGPTEDGEIRRINREWFSCDSAASHSVTGVPVATQLAGFERARGDYLLQLDVDVMIGRRDRAHDFLSDMLFALDGDDRNVSVSFNIPHGHIAYRRYDAPPGGFVPEVRCGLIDRRKLLTQRPLPNAVGATGAVELTWYRSLQRHQGARGLRSVRGGDGRSFFIHPMNTIKRQPDRWMKILDQIERRSIPAVQFEHHDLVEEPDAWDRAVGDPYECLVRPSEELIPLVGATLREQGHALVTVRHGAKSTAPAGASWSDLQGMSLADEGLPEIDAFAARLPAVPRQILCSSLPRCRQTAARIAEQCGGAVRVTVCDDLLGGRFERHDAWLDMKRRLGWSQLVERWIAGDVLPDIVTPYANWIDAVRPTVAAAASAPGLNIMISQGYVTTALAHSLTGRVEMRGGALHGFVWPANRV